MTPSRPYLLALAALLTITPAAAAEVYKWVDEDGVTHYSQQPPPSGTPTVLTPDSAPPAATAEGEGGNGEEEDSDADGENDDSGPGTVAEFCTELRDRQKVLQSDRPIRIKAEDGTLTDLDEEGRAERLERVQSQLRDHCQGLEAEAG